MRKAAITGIVCAASVATLAATAHAQTPSAQQEIQALKREIETQRRQLEQQQRRLEQLERQITQAQPSAPRAPAPAAAPQAPSAPAVAATAPAARPAQPTPAPAQAAAAPAARPAPPGPVGQAPDTSKPPEVPVLADVRGVLTPRGQLVLEPSLQYSHSSSSRVALLGFTIIPAITIGLIDVRNVNRDSFIAQIAARYGITNRFEFETKIPYIYQRETTLSQPLVDVPAQNDDRFQGRGSGLGDIEFIGRYQLNQPVDGPYYVAGLRFKSRSGRSPFEDVDAVTGLQRRLATGSGFYAVEPSMTAILPSDPAVFFGNVNYVWNIKRDLGGTVGEIEPGNAFGFTAGMGLGLNEKASLSIGYQHSTLYRPKQNGVLIANTSTVQLGSLLFGLSYRLSPKTTFNFTLGAGVTPDTPDLQLIFRLPMQM